VEWKTEELPQDDTFVLLTLEEDGNRWVEPGWYHDARFTDIHRGAFAERIVAWMAFPKAYEETAA
jgi:hypothetical protein